ncbi:hypothetical protein COT98_03370 [Candidatus Falkowbacteria bacterium CG10_big_fil_rev_8_21_14_0_10_39_9]|uniref:Uncharacterized protein n=1 Tax=Candidatus Falkowbacteria bacterium CG10_big_fil_rev_8_21_14_0_10_39_9 TaxID=1974566 RepID=A0A2M6WP05_9BACT|nr:MAG: hypothetical protein COT98_03370 [Candidatus Falkowbacteria bacterium CG10_big_fil_rev_8_21_14_0_10_39_9]
MNILKKIASFSILLIIAFAFLNPCHAGLLTNSSTTIDQTSALTNKAGFNTSFSVGEIVAIIIRMALGLLGIIFLVLLVMGGYQWMTAGGSEEQVEKAQSRIKNGIIGLVIVLAAYAITAFVFTHLSFTGGGPTPI